MAVIWHVEIKIEHSTMRWTWREDFLSEDAHQSTASSAQNACKMQIRLQCTMELVFFYKKNSTFLWHSGFFHPIYNLYIQVGNKYTKRKYLTNEF